MSGGSCPTIESFHALHKKRYAFDMRQKPVEMLAVRQDVIGTRGWKIPNYALTENCDAATAIKLHRPVCFPRSRELRLARHTDLRRREAATGPPTARVLPSSRRSTRQSSYSRATISS